MKCRPSSRLAEALLALGLAALGAGCSPLAMVVRADAPGFDVKRPASTYDGLGARILNNQPDTNRCFAGTPSDKPFQGWSNRTLSYSASGGGKLQGDFGGYINVGVGASGGRTLEVTLKDMFLDRLDGLYFDPKGTCATDETERARYLAPEGVHVRVVTQVLGAGSIDIVDQKEAGVQLEASAANIPVKITPEANGKSRSTWSGIKLYVAHYHEKFKVTWHSATGCDKLSVGSGQTCDLEACSLRIDAAADDSYKAIISCQDGSSFPLDAKFGAWQGQRTAAGVSVSLRCRKTDQSGIFSCDYGRWSVLSE